MNMKGMCEKKLWLLLISLPVQPWPADVVTDWNVTGMDASSQNSLVQSRALAITHAALFDAVNAIAGKYEAAYLAE
jgi:hypothetical protein